jgi:carbonic anhydrase/acetyltransferase-like protein (isoleucine patch superfamily)
VRVARLGRAPRIDPSATVTESAILVGDVTIGARSYVDHGVVIESGGPPITVGDDVVVLANSTIRSVGGRRRPASEVRIGPRTLVSPMCLITGALIGARCYVASGAIILQGAVLGDEVRVGVGAIVHAGAEVPSATRIGIRHIAVPVSSGVLATADVDRARRALTEGRFFERAFGVSREDIGATHEDVMSILLDEVHSWD